MEGAVLVTGAARGIGQAIAEYLAAENMQVVITDVEAHQELLAQVAKGSQGRISLAPAGDLSDEAFRQRLMKEAEALHGGLFGLVNNAGLGLFTPFLGGTELTEVQRCFEVNLLAPLRLSQLWAESRVRLNKPGAIVNVSSQSSTVAFWAHTSYSVSKAAVDQLTKHLAVELGPKQIRCNAAPREGFRNGLHVKRLLRLLASLLYQLYHVYHNMYLY